MYVHVLKATYFVLFLDCQEKCYREHCANSSLHEAYGMFTCTYVVWYVCLPGGLLTYVHLCCIPTYIRAYVCVCSHIHMHVPTYIRT